MANFQNLMIKVWIELASLWTRSTWLMQNGGVQPQILVTQTSKPPSVLFKRPWAAQAFWSLSFMNFKRASVCWKASDIPEMLTPRDCETLVRSGHHWHLCQSEHQRSTCDSLNRFPFHQSRPVKPNHETGKCAVTCAYMWMRCDSIGRKKKEKSERGNEKREAWGRETHPPTYQRSASTS